MEISKCQSIANSISYYYNLPYVKIKFNPLLAKFLHAGGRCITIGDNHIIELDTPTCLRESEKVITDIIKHELAHTKYPNHKKEFVKLCYKMGVSDKSATANGVYIKRNGTLYPKCGGFNIYNQQ